MSVSGDLATENGWGGVSRAAWAVVGTLGVVVLLAFVVLIGSIVPQSFSQGSGCSNAPASLRSAHHITSPRCSAVP
jgi:hypothetical protein